jgi:hypothetical protein
VEPAPGTEPLPVIPGIDLQGFIGRGASSVVYVGTQTSIGRKVAVKMLDLPGQSALVAKLFLNECRTLGQLVRHPSIVVVHDAGFADDGRPYLVMEYLPGGTLAQRLAADGPLPVADVLEIGVHLSGALATTHRHGIVHGDVKPQNVMQSRSGQVALSDFGIARLLGAASSTTRVPIFTPLHAAPELFEGSLPTERTDVYELCSTMFELLDGRPALGSDTESPLVIVGRLAKGERRTLDGSVPPALVDLIDRGLSIDPAERHASASELGEALRSLQRSLDLDPTPLVVLEDAGVDTHPEQRLAHPVDRPTLPPDGTTGSRWSAARPRALFGVAAALIAALVVAVALGLESRGDDAATVTTVRAAEPGPTSAPATPTTEGPLPTVTTLLVPGIQPDVTYDVAGVASSSEAIEEALGRVDFDVLDPAAEVFDFPAFGIQRTTVKLRYQFINPSETLECPGFLSPPVLLEGASVKALKYGPGRGDYGILQVYRFSADREARTAFTGFSLEQGPVASECWGFQPAPLSGVSDPDDFGVRRRSPEVELPGGVEWNTWSVPSTDERYAHAFKVLTQRGSTIVLAIFNTTLRSGPEQPEQVSALMTRVWEQLPP